MGVRKEEGYMLVKLRSPWRGECARAHSPRQGERSFTSM